jgi:hypothetical protein
VGGRVRHLTAVEALYLAVQVKTGEGSQTLVDGRGAQAAVYERIKPLQDVNLDYFPGGFLFEGKKVAPGAVGDAAYVAVV